MSGVLLFCAQQKKEDVFNVELISAAWMDLYFVLFFFLIWHTFIYSVVLTNVSEDKRATGAALHLKSLPSLPSCDPPEPEPVFDLLCENPRPPLLHGGPVPGGHEDLDGCHSNGRRGLHAVHELRDHWVTDFDWASAQTPASRPDEPLPRRSHSWDRWHTTWCATDRTFEEMNYLGLSWKEAWCLWANEGSAMTEKF